MQRLCSAVANPVIFDVGAHHGTVSHQYRELFPDSTLYAFEPFPDSYERLQANTARDSMIRAFNLGFADATGPRLLSSNSLAVTNSLLETDGRGASIWGQGLYETTEWINADFSSIDDFVAEMNIPTIDILKMDVQGAEHLVLKGAERSIAASRIKLIYTEIITVPTYIGQKEFYEILRFFSTHGFVLHNFYNPVTKDGKLLQVDAIFTLPTSPDLAVVSRAGFDGDSQTRMMRPGGRSPHHDSCPEEVPR